MSRGLARRRGAPPSPGWAAGRPSCWRCGRRGPRRLRRADRVLVAAADLHRRAGGPAGRSRPRRRRARAWAFGFGWLAPASGGSTSACTSTASCRRGCRCWRWRARRAAGPYYAIAGWAWAGCGATGRWSTPCCSRRSGCWPSWRAAVPHRLSLDRRRLCAYLRPAGRVGALVGVYGIGARPRASRAAVALALLAARPQAGRRCSR